MGYPFDQATWNVVEGAMFAGAGTIAPGLYTAIGVVICVVVLWMGNKSEKQRYAEHKE